MFVDKLKSLLQDPPPAMAFEISEAGIAAARISTKAELEFEPLKPGTLAVSPLQENVTDEDEFRRAVRSLSSNGAARKRKDVALILPDYCTRTSVLDFDSFPSDAREQLALIRFRSKRSVPFDVESAALGYWAQPASHKRIDVVVVMAPVEIVARYEAPFRAAGLHPGLVTTSALAALELAPESGLSVLAKLSGRILTVLVREKTVLKLVRCLEMPSAALDDIAAVLAPTLVYMEDNLGGRADRLLLCGFGGAPSGPADEAQRRFEEELQVPTELVRSPLAIPGETDAGLLGYLKAVARNN
jgi:type IV pilus assembly protein PilM